jgi:hypothetical protein
VQVAIPPHHPTPGVRPRTLIVSVLLPHFPQMTRKVPSKLTRSPFFAVFLSVKANSKHGQRW